MTVQIEFSPEAITVFNDEWYSYPVPLVQYSAGWKRYG